MSRQPTAERKRKIEVEKAAALKTALFSVSTR